MKRFWRDRYKRTQGQKACLRGHWQSRTWFWRGNGSKPTEGAPESTGARCKIPGNTLKPTGRTFGKVCSMAVTGPSRYGASAYPSQRELGIPSVIDRLIQ